VAFVISLRADLLADAAVQRHYQKARRNNLKARH
jgi:hypothetical protein